MIEIDFAPQSTDNTKKNNEPNSISYILQKKQNEQSAIKSHLEKKDDKNNFDKK